MSQTPDTAGFVSAIGRLESATTTLIGEVERLREFKETIIALCPVHAQRIKNVEDGIGEIKVILERGDRWMKARDVERAAFHGGWKVLVLVSTAVSGAVAILAALKGML